MCGSIVQIKPEIVKRVQKQNYSKNNSNCYICGKLFKSDACPHNWTQQEWALEEVQKMELLYEKAHNSFK